MKYPGYRMRNFNLNLYRQIDPNIFDAVKYHTVYTPISRMICLYQEVRLPYDNLKELIGYIPSSTSINACRYWSPGVY